MLFRSAAVTRYGCRRGEGSEGCETRFRGRKTWLEAPQGVFSVVYPKRTEPHDRVQGATSLRGARGGSRRSREERQGRNELEAGIFEPKGGLPPGSGRAVRISMEGHLWKTPGEEFELPAQVGRFVGFVPMTRRAETGPTTRKRGEADGAQALAHRELRTACKGESSRSLSLKET